MWHINRPGFAHMLVTAPAKINLSLDIVKRRADGYHLLATVMQSLDLADLLTINVTASPSAGVMIELSSNLALLPLDRQNIAYRAAELFFAKAKNPPQGLRLKIHLEKKIPLAAGLAGGSANAAAVLFALDRMFPQNFSETELFRLASKIGADVPFCLKGGTVLCEGIGEILTDLPHWDDLAVLLLLPRQALLTKDIFRAYGLHGKNSTPDTAAVISAIQARDLPGLARSSANVLEKASFSFLPGLADLKRQLEQSGAILAQMTGSGPSLFGLFADRSACLAAEKTLRTKLPGLDFIVCRSQAGGPQIVNQEE